MDLGESSLDNALKFDHIDPADYRPWNRVNPQLVSMLQKRSQDRVGKPIPNSRSSTKISRASSSGRAASKSR